jgi:hypothetical protein
VPAAHGLHESAFSSSLNVLMGHFVQTLLLIKRPRSHARAAAVALTEAVALTAEAVPGEAVARAEAVPEAVACTAEAVPEAVADEVAEAVSGSVETVVGTLARRRTARSSRIVARAVVYCAVLSCQTLSL